MDSIKDSEINYKGDNNEFKKKYSDNIFSHNVYNKLMFL